MMPLLLVSYLPADCRCTRCLRPLSEHSAAEKSHFFSSLFTAAKYGKPYAGLRLFNGGHEFIAVKGPYNTQEEAELAGRAIDDVPYRDIYTV